MTRHTGHFGCLLRRSPGRYAETVWSRCLLRTGTTPSAFGDQLPRVAVYRSRFGEPVPPLVTTPVVAAFTMAVFTVAGAADGCADR
jgi:hypothetical protein